MVRVSRRVGTIHKKLVLGSAQPEPSERAGQLSIRRSKEDRPTRATREESAPLPHSASHPVRSGHSPATRGQLPSPPRFWSSPKPTSRPKAVRARLKVAKRTTADATGSSRFTLDGFTYSFTFFSKFFSSFPHGTCSLSVSSEYLALEGYYLPFCAAVPSNTTLWKQFLMAVRIPWTYTGLLPSMARCLNNELLQERGRTSSSRPQFPQVRPGDFRIELSPLHSPLLRGSLLVSFPPLNNMFKFSGSSYLSSALDKASFLSAIRSTATNSRNIKYQCFHLY